MDFSPEKATLSAKVVDFFAKVVVFFVKLGLDKLIAARVSTGQRS
jgi:hypothetical protein